ncbi:hypothetical protein EDD36DRAFT_118942 [Exophiala viscosa]|uniref:Enoyl reductase (ER) domain-containing protein n=1 Tax=Exophiala viscosa TaxID=2486360 RepID=A0AAN6E0A9_9EURO|nr:hypothetical protein EDD36DRAFT_118942 [Exophiala viscosa]
MKAIQLPALVKSPDGLQVSSLPDLKPSPTKYVIRIRACAMNFFDILQIQGKHQQRPPLPFIAGNEFAGEVLAVPTGTKWNPTFKVGDGVFGAGLGAFATMILAEEVDLRPIPKGWGYKEASSLFYTAPTAYAALILRARAKKGDYVLVHGAAGGVGLAAVSIAKFLGMTVIATSNTPNKMEIARKFGADHVVDSNGDWASTVKKHTPGGRGVDVVLDPLGLINQSLKCIRWDGRLVVIGFAAGEIEKIATNRILLKNVSVSGLFWGEYANQDPEAVTQVWNILLKVIDKGGIKSIAYTERTFSGLESVSDALKLLSTGTAWGKIVVELSGDEKSRL